MKKRTSLKIMGFIGMMSLIALMGVTVYLNQLPNVTAMNYDAPRSEHFDSDGNLLVPFDIAYPEAFASGDYVYSEDTVMLKFPQRFNGEVTDELAAEGVVSLTESFQTDDAIWMEAQIDDPESLPDTLWMLRRLDGIMVVDYNYLYESEDINHEHALNLSDIASNPRAEDQWYLDKYGIPEAWAFMESEGLNAGGSDDVIVAVIDTGVDYTHPDLAANMWVNQAETANGRDDDGNGFIDDIHGVSVIGNTRDYHGDPMDDHGHGTHVAGIIAAADNNLGIVGVAHNVQIMAIKAGMASGFFSANSIAAGIHYAYEHGADVINMSFGGGAASIAVQDALQLAYTQSVLVAAAGNSGLPNQRTKFYPAAPSYPAALSYVLGVMSVDAAGRESVFTNWDPYTFNSVEYELYAPGENILSTLPNDQYISWNGTSMAAPIVAGIAALVRSAYPDRDVYPNKFIMGQLAATSETRAIDLNPNLRGDRDYPLAKIVDAELALSSLPKPEVHFFNHYMFDPSTASDANNGDGVVDAGETIETGVVLINRWGKSENTIVTLNAITPMGESDPYITFETDTINYGDVGYFSTKDFLTRDRSIVKGVEIPFVFTIDEDTPNDYILRMNVEIQYENAIDPDDDTTYRSKATIIFTVRKGEILPNQITEDTELTNDKFYIIPNSMFIHKEATVTVQSGTSIQFWSDDPNDAYADDAMAYLNVEGRFIVEGTLDAPVEMFPSQLRENFRVEINEREDGFVSIDHANIVNPQLNISVLTNSRLSNNHYLSLNYRYLSNGRIVPRTSANNNRIDYASRNIIQNIGSNVSYSQASFTGHYENNIFSEVIANFNGTYEDNVFLTNNGSRFNTNYSSNANIAGIKDLSIESVVYNAELGKTYLRVNLGSQSNNQLYAEELATYFGGQLAIIETEEEYEFIANQVLQNYRSAFIGLRDNYASNTAEWLDGTPYGLEVKLEEDLDYRLYTMYRNYNLSTTSFTKSTNTNEALIEIDGDIYASGLFPEAPSVAIDLESSHQLNVRVQPETARVDNLIYVSEDPRVVTVSAHGVIHPVSKGEATVFVYTDDYQRHSSVNVSVIEKIELTSFELDLAKTQINLGETLNLDVSITPLDTTENQFTFESSDASIATIDRYGEIEGHQAGTVTLTATHVASNTAKTITISVVKPVESIAFEESVYVTDLAQETDVLSLEIFPMDATNQSMTWESSNPDVAYIDEDGDLVKLKNGVTTLKATAANTDISAEIVVSIAEEQVINDVIAMAEDDGYYFALNSDGFIYYWGQDVKSPKRLPLPTELSIQDFFINKDYWVHMYVLLGDNTVEKYRLRSYIYDQGSITEMSSPINNYSDIVAIEGSYNGYSRYFLRESGSVLAYGYNNYGQLGDGSTTDRSALIQVPLSNVEKIVGITSRVTFLTTDNKLYLTGNYDGDNISSPILIAENVENVAAFMGQINYLTANQVTAIGNQSYTLINDTHRAKYDESYYISGGSVYVKGNYNDFGEYGVGEANTRSTYVPMEKIDSASRVFWFANNIFIQTTDNAFYGTGRNGSYELANFTTENSLVPSQIFFGLEGNGDTLSVSTLNIEENTLSDESITLTFNESLVRGSEYPFIRIEDEDGLSIALSTNLHLNRMELTPFDSLTVGDTYQLIIPAEALTTKFMVPNALISIEFTYLGGQTALALESTNISSNMQLSDQTVAFTQEYTYALAGPQYSGIKITNENDASMPVTVTLEDSVLTIAGTLPYGDYTLVIPAGALKDNLGNQNAAVNTPFSILETLTITEQSHADGSSRHAVDTPITFTFNDVASDAQFDSITLETLDGTSVAHSRSLANDILTLTPEADLAEGTTYQVVIPEDALKGPLNDGNPAWTFTFETYAPIAFISSNLDHLPQTFDLNGTVVLDYNYLEAGTAVDDIQLCADACVPVELDLSTTRLTIQPTQALSPDTEYTLTIPTSALTDENGETLSAQTLSFKTLAQTPRFYWNENNVQAELDAFMEEGLHSRFIGNAILNNFTETDVDLWLRFTANSGSTEYSAGFGSNYFGTDDEAIIDKHFFDFDTVIQLIDIKYGSVATTAPENTFPFVTDIKILDGEGEEKYSYDNETVTFVVTFNRDMDTSVPLDFRFGSSLPYAEYKIAGSYTDARTWEGTYELRSFVESGNQYFSVRNGHAEGDPWLQLLPDVKRFTFIYDTTEALAMNLQGSAQTDGIELSWTQDDYDTLAGYNVYRSQSENGMYHKLNSQLIPTNQTTFKDENVEPGQIYYYNFTVVLTDFTESETSGKVSVRAYDTMAPNVYHTPVNHSYDNQNIVIRATATDNLQIDSVELYYRVSGAATWTTLDMTPLNSRYTAFIPASQVDTAGMEYYIKVSDGVNDTLKGSETNPFTIQVQAPVDNSQKGDINMDGTINSPDALLILQAMHDRINLSHEAFIRADLNDNGILELAEALRILQYVSGQVGDLIIASE